MLLGVVIGAQGLKGEVKVKTFTETPEALAAYGPLHTKDGREIRVTYLRETKDGAVVQLHGVNDRTNILCRRRIWCWRSCRGMRIPPVRREFSPAVNSAKRDSTYQN